MRSAMPKPCSCSLADASVRRDLGGPAALRPGVLEHGEMRLVDIVETGRMQAIEDALADRLVRDTQQRADQRNGRFGRRISKVT